MKTILVKWICAIGAVILISGCGTMIGIPSHGGGKRFAIEQELVSASSRAALKELDLKSLAGKKVALYVSLMGDEGSGVLSGGRYSIEGLLRGEYSNLPKSQTSNKFPTTTNTAISEAGGMQNTTIATSVLNHPSISTSKTKGSGHTAYAATRINGLGDYRNETLITNPKDASYLTNLVQTVFFLRGINIVPQQFADVDVFVFVDVFGTIRSRTETYVYNNESLKAVTKLEMFAIDRKTKNIILKPIVSAYEAVYQENYALWIGPFNKMKKVKKADALLVDFSDIQPYSSETNGQISSTEFLEKQEGGTQVISKEIFDRVIEKRRHKITKE